MEGIPQQMGNFYFIFWFLAVPSPVARKGRPTDGWICRKLFYIIVNYPIDNRYLIIYILTINKESSMKTDKNSSMIEVGKFRILIDKYSVCAGSIPADWEFITMFVLPDDKG